MDNHKTLAAAVALALLAFTPAAKAQEADADAWAWKYASYAWISDVRADMTVRGEPVSSEVSFSDIVDKMDFSQQVHIEGQGRDWGVMADLTYLALSDGKDFTNLSTDASLDTVLLDAAMVWSPGEQKATGIELLGGIRYLSADMEVDFDLVDPLQPDQTRSVDKSFTDALVGVRYLGKLSDNWGYSLRGDTSFGATEGTWSATAALQYHRKRGTWLFAYRYLDISLDAGGRNAELTMFGPMIGYSFNRGGH
jgi:hypothetical protein